MLRRHLLPLPVHARRLPVINLHPIHADVALASSRIARVHARQRNKPPPIMRPALQNRKRIQIEVPRAESLPCTAHPSRSPSSETHSPARQAAAASSACPASPSGAFTFISAADALRNLIQPLHAQRHRHAPLAAELVDQHLVPGMPLHVLKQQRRPAGRIRMAVMLSGTFAQ